MLRMPETEDERWMKKALKLAEQGRGYVSPNPMVGCVIVNKENNQIGAGYHEKYGESHAEVNAVKTVKDKTELIDATMYVTLEPCSHHGKTPPCAPMVADLPLKRVVIAAKDPNPKVDGKGIEIIKNAGIEVTVGVCEKEANKLNEYFNYFMKFKKPFVTLKMAQTADGYIAAPDGSSQWISGKLSRMYVHKWRSWNDAVLIGRNTALLDNPALTVRHVDGRQPYRIVLDGPGELPSDLNLFTDQYENKTLRVTSNRDLAVSSTDQMLQILSNTDFKGETLFVSENEDGHVDLDELLKKLGERNITSVLVEAGNMLASAMIKQNLVDKLELFIAPKLLGGGTRSLLGLGIDRMSEIIEMNNVHWQLVGDDMLLTAYL
jgi:diaminohydroxyphosphoribosylaminopyrimidine deaminase/5-amino-6-(5-phosphoribosylamino)uracil reductase